MRLRLSVQLIPCFLIIRGLSSCLFYLLGKTGRCPLLPPRLPLSCPELIEHECDVDADCKNGQTPMCCQDGCGERTCAAQVTSKSRFLDC